MKKRPQIVLLSAAVLVGLVLAYAAGRGSHRPEAEDSRVSRAAPATQAQTQIYTCSMHPQVRLKELGKCPVCGMPLIPADAVPSKSEGGPMLQLSEHAIAMASVETTPVTRRALAHELRAVGKIQYNESSLATVTARVDGYAERIFVNITGVAIKSGDHLADIYSPDLLVAQQELLIALQGGSSPRGDPLVETASLKLKRWGLTEDQVKALIEQKMITDRVTLLSPINGTVIEKTIVENSAFKAGDVLYRVANLDTVWVYLDIYEYDLPWLRFGQRVDISAEALPGRTFTGVVTFVQPIVTEETRTVRVPVHVVNEDHALKPGMFVSATVKATLSASGDAAPTGLEGKYTCPMHPQVLRDEPGKCPICEMPLETVPGTPANGLTHAAPEDHATSRPAAGGDVAIPLVIPASAVLDSGTRRIAYVEMFPGLFEARDVTVGPRSAEFVSVLKGLSDGEHVVTRGGFLIDSQFQITGRPSLFYPGGLAAGTGAGHQHGGGSTGSDMGGAKPADAAPLHKH